MDTLLEVLALILLIVLIVGLWLLFDGEPDLYDHIKDYLINKFNMEKQ